MAKITSKQRAALPASAFALPKQRKYPVTDGEGNPDPEHAANAKARAAGTGAKNLSSLMQQAIDAKANKVGGW